MHGSQRSGRTTRRRFAFWIGFGIFALGEKLHAKGFDTLAAAAMRATEAKPLSHTPKTAIPEHWTFGENNTWRWFEREQLLGGQWRVTGITTPIHKQTGESAKGRGYLDDSLIPESMRKGSLEATRGAVAEIAFEHDYGKPSRTRRDRHGRPPSRWLRSLRSEELRLWLKTIEVPEAGVEGMTYWEHLTRDHSFDPDKIAGLDEPDQAKLHAAAHYGY